MASDTILHVDGPITLEWLKTQWPVEEREDIVFVGGDVQSDETYLALWKRKGCELMFYDHILRSVTTQSRFILLAAALNLKSLPPTGAKDPNKPRHGPKPRWMKAQDLSNEGWSPNDPRFPETKEKA